MKKLILLLMFALPFIAKAGTSYHSIGTGNWSNSAIWSPTGVPTTADDVTVSSGNTVTQNVHANYCNNLTVNGTLKLTSGNGLGVYGLLTNNGTISGSGPIGTKGTGTVITGTGSWTFTGSFYFEGSPQTIDAGVNLTLSTGNVYMDVTDNGNSEVDVTNNGTVTLSTGSINSTNSTIKTVWTNGTNSSVSVHASSWNSSNDYLDATASGNTVKCSGSGTTSYTLKKPNSATFYNLTIDGSGTKTIPEDLSLNTLQVNSGSTLSVGGYNLTLTGDWTNNGTITNNTATTTFNGSGTETIGGSTSTTFTNLITYYSATAQASINTNISGEVTNRGGISGSSNITFLGTGTVLTGSGSWSSHSGNINFAGSTQTIDNNVTINKSTGSIILDVIDNSNNPVSVTNNGYINLTDPSAGFIRSNGSSISTSWTNNNSTEVSAASWIQSSDVLHAENYGNTIVYFNISSSYSLKQPYSAYYQININNTSSSSYYISFPSDITAGIVWVQGYGNLNINGYNLNLTNGIDNALEEDATGSIINNTGIVTFGTPAGDISSTGTISFNNIIANAILYVNSNINVSGALTLGNYVTLANYRTITMLSNSTSTAKIATVPSTASITNHSPGTFVIERYDGRTTGARECLSTPVYNDLLSDWTGQTNFFSDFSAGHYSVFTWSESASAYSAVTSPTYTMTPGSGLYMVMANGTDSAVMSPYTYTSTGAPNYGDITQSITYTTSPYQNLIGNPYPSPISWSSFSSDNSSIIQTSCFYVFGQDGNWHTHNDIIPMGQGFEVVATAGGTATFHESQKSSTDTAIFAPIKESNSLDFVLSNDANKYSCTTTVSFAKDYTKAYNSTEDAMFIYSPLPDAPQLYTVSSDKQNLMLNRLPETDSTIDVPLTAVGKVAGNYAITMQGLGHFTNYNCITLIDKSTGEVVNNFEDNHTYSFRILSANEERDFVIEFTKLAEGKKCKAAQSNTIASVANNVDIVSSSTGALVYFHLPQSENATITVFNLLGQQVSETRTNAYDNQVSLNLEQGIYIVRVVLADNSVIIKKIYR